MLCFFLITRGHVILLQLCAVPTLMSLPKKHVVVVMQFALFV